MIDYRIEIEDAAAHLFRVTLTVPQPLAGQRLSLPVWIPGSYMVREFGRHLRALQAHSGRREVTLEQLDKTSWRVPLNGAGAAGAAGIEAAADGASVRRDPRAALPIQPLVVRYLVYAFDASVRTAWLDETRGFFNATSLCLRVEGQEHLPHGVRFGALPKGWQIATAMTPAAALEAATAKPRARAINATGTAAAMAFSAGDYDELADHPVELGPFWRGQFEAGGVPHEFVVSGAWPGFDGERLLADARRICTAQIAFWHGRRKPPFARYVFMLHAVEDGYGGLEHRASTALIANRRDLPRPDQPGQSDGYVTLLGLISHEYFHTWNVKRLKPAEFAAYDYTRENYTALLWFFEGFTSYYDDLFLLRCGLIDAPRYLKLIARALNGVLSTPGRLVQSVAEASFDAWVKYYRTDENTPNATVSYYTKGAWLALLLDLRLRQAGHTLDELMQTLWRERFEALSPKRSRRDTAGAQAPRAAGALTQDDIFELISRLGGSALRDEFAGWVHGRDDPPWQALLTTVGVHVQAETPTLASALGLRLSEGAFSGVQVKSVLAGSAAARAGLSAGDELLAVDGWRIRRLDDAQQWVRSGQAFDVLLVRQQRVRTLRVQPAPKTANPAAQAGAQLALTLQPAAPAAALALRQGWLGS
jgi:predicted metalloprotease with PDZ domain